jgi:prolyl-tRNA synthetase
MSVLLGKTVKETPKDAELPSHKFLLRGGFVRQYTAGVYGLLPLARKVIAKIECIIREEMNAVEGQEVSLPCLSTAELWSESGRYQAIGKDMFRLKDRHDRPMVLNMTHEEPVVFMARSELTSHKQLPFMLYQIQSKFRDEPRPRGGLVRLREFSMKDAYSFHATEEDLKTYYDRMHLAYERIFRRAGMKNFVSVESDNGMFGGRYSHEFQLLVPTGEDTLITCSNCDYKANLEIAHSPFTKSSTPQSALAKVATPNARTIAEVSKFLSVGESQTAKAVLMQDNEAALVVAFIRGDLDVVIPKLQTLVQRALVPAKDEVIRGAGAVPGSTGPMGLDLARCTVVVDQSLLGLNNLVWGANEDGFHYQGASMERDFFAKLTAQERKNVIQGDCAQARAGDPCPSCGKELAETRGIEVGNIFHLGTKYSGSMNCSYLDKDGKKQTPIMGCYGIGVTRMLAAVIEEHHDQYGIRFPISIAPYQVHLCSINLKDAEVRTQSEKLYQDLQRLGFEVLWDDRDEKAGSQFADADLMGIPFRLIVSPKTLAQGACEYVLRSKERPAELLPLADVFGRVQADVDTAQRGLNG